MTTHRLILPGDLNQFGVLFGGRLLAWVDEASWIAAKLEFPRCRFVTIGMEAVTFRESVGEGGILEIESRLAARGTTSVTYEVTVREGAKAQQREVFGTRVTFVNIGEDGGKLPID